MKIQFTAPRTGVSVTLDVPDEFMARAGYQEPTHIEEIKYILERAVGMFAHSVSGSVAVGSQLPESFSNLLNGIKFACEMNVELIHKKT